MWLVVDMYGAYCVDMHAGVYVGVYAIANIDDAVDVAAVADGECVEYAGDVVCVA